jgi:thiol-disulfide isomerase/thioredoxin
MFDKSIKAGAAFLILILSVGFALTAEYAQAQTVCCAPNPVLGPRTWGEWKAEAGWDNYEAGEYSPPQWKLAQFAELAQSRNATFVIFGGSWCHDSRAQLPVLFRLFNLASIPAERQQLFGVDGNVKEPTRTADRFNVSRVPTVIVLSNGREIGRISEFPRPNWEDDLIRVLSG